MDRQAFIDKLFTRAQSEGFEAYEAYYVKGNSFEVSVFGGEIVDYTVSESLGLGFRALTGGKMGYASTQALDDDAVEFLIASVKDSAALIENDDPQFIFGGGEAYAQVDNYSQALDAVTPAQKIAFARELEKAALAQDPRIQRVDGCSVMTESSERAIRNSKGLNLASRQNVAVAYVAPIAEENGRVNTGMKFQMEQEFSALDAQAIAKAAVERALTRPDGATTGFGDVRNRLREPGGGEPAWRVLLHLFGGSGAKGPFPAEGARGRGHRQRGRYHRGRPAPPAQRGFPAV